MRPRFVGDAAFVHLAQIWAIASRTFETESSTACFSSSHFSMANRSTASQNSAYESISESSTGGSSLDLRPDEAFVRLPRDFFEHMGARDEICAKFAVGALFLLAVGALFRLVGGEVTVFAAAG